MRDFCAVSNDRKGELGGTNNRKTLLTLSMDRPLPCEIIKGPLKGVNAKKEGTLSKLPSVLTAADIFTEAAVIRPFPHGSFDRGEGFEE